MKFGAAKLEAYDVNYILSFWMNITDENFPLSSLLLSLAFWYSFFHSEGHIGLERKVTKLEAMVKMLQEDLKKVGDKDKIIYISTVYLHTVQMTPYFMCAEFKFIFMYSFI